MMPEPPHERLDSNPWPEWPREKKRQIMDKMNLLLSLDVILVFIKQLLKSLLKMIKEM